MDELVVAVQVVQVDAVAEPVVEIESFGIVVVVVADFD